MRSAAIAIRTSSRKATSATTSDDHRGDEQHRDRGGEVHGCEGAREEQCDHQRHQQRRDGDQRDRDVDQLRAPRQHAQLAADFRRIVHRVAEYPAFRGAGAVDDSRKAGGQHAEYHADTRQQEHRRDRELDRVGDVDDFDAVHWRAGSQMLRRHSRRRHCSAPRANCNIARRRVFMPAFKDHFSRQSAATAAIGRRIRPS